MIASPRQLALSGSPLALLGALALAAGGCGGSHSGSSASGPTTAPPAGQGASAGQGSLLAATGSGPSGQPIDGIQCLGNEQVAFHIHAHVAVFVAGASRTIPAGIGIEPPLQVENTSEGTFVGGGRCFYWLHSHTPDGVIHIESPVQRTFTLGDYFDVYGQPLGPNQVGPARGPVTAYLDGKRYPGDPRSIPLRSHAVIQLDVGGEVAPQPYSFPQGL